MALADTAKLLASLDLDTKAFEAGARRAGASLGQMESRFGKIGGIAQRGLQTAARNVAALGVAAGGFVALNVKSGIESLAQLEDATTAVDGAIKQMGLTGKVTAGQIATWANEIESSVQAAFDDKAITQATASLIRIGKVTDTNLRPAMVVMTDLAATLGGDIPAASKTLAKALAAPEKAAGRLTRVGITLTDEQQDQIKAMVEVGDTAGAQAKLLDIMAQSTAGAAAASKGPFNDAMNIMKDSVEDVQRVLGTAFLPVLEKVSSRLSTAISDPKFMASVREFGETLAGGFDKLLEIGGKIPWETIGNSLRIAGTGAKAVFDAFTMLPDWVQTAVLTGWGLNKLSGGALGGIVGELGKGLIKGVLGMNAGVVNINAGVVNGAGGVPNAPAAGGSVLGTALKVTVVGFTAAAALELGTQIAGINDPSHQLTGGGTNRFGGTTFRGTNDKTEQLINLQQAELRLAERAAAGDDFAARQLAGVRTEIAKLTAGPLPVKLNRSGSPDDRSDKLIDIAKSTQHLVDRTEKFGNAELRNLERIVKHTKDDPEDTSKKQKQHFDKTQARIDILRQSTSTKLAAVQAVEERVRDRVESARQAVQTGTTRVADRTTTAADRIIAAINRLELVTNVNVNVSGTSPYQSSGSYGGGGGGRKAG